MRELINALTSVCLYEIFSFKFHFLEAPSWLPGVQVEVEEESAELA